MASKGTVVAVAILGGLVGQLLDVPHLLGFSALFFISPIVAFVGLRHVNGTTGRY